MNADGFRLLLVAANDDASRLLSRQSSKIREEWTKRSRLAVRAPDFAPFLLKNFNR